MYALSEFVIDFSDVPLNPFGTRDEQKLEAALIVGTLYSPEVVELLKDPVERTTWIDSLAVAAAAYAKYKAGKPISKIAEEVGRSEHTIRAHIQGKTKAGKLIISTYEKLKAGTLRVVVPFVSGAPQVEAKTSELERKVQELARERDALLAKVSELEREVENLRKQLEACREESGKLSRVVDAVKSRLQALEEIKQLISELA
ncbi:transcriptional regulator [Thermogladius sp.]|uniref:transcriptional regulator n=1 Tax=Thermogladius sp. TaxID=2023064 RepID=UPI003D09E1CD